MQMSDSERKVMGRWKFRVNFRDHVLKYQELKATKENLRDFQVGAAKILRDSDIDLDGIEDVVEDFENANLTEVEEVDYALNEIYDWADNVGVFLGL